jgi:hypothetical protein
MVSFPVHPVIPSKFVFFFSVNAYEHRFIRWREWFDKAGLKIYLN